MSSVVRQVAIFAEGFFAVVLNIVTAPSWSRVYSTSKKQTSDTCQSVMTLSCTVLHKGQH